MSDADQVLKQIEKEHGDKVAGYGVKLDASPRLPTGVFPFDLASGGGFPLGRISVLYGHESSLKTTLALKAIGMHQQLWPDRKCVFVDAEHSYDAEWARKMGVDNDQLVFVQPDHAEQAVDVTDQLLEAEDVGLVVFDSLAALITQRESESSAEKANVGSAGLMAAALYRRATQAIARQTREGRHPALIVINQIRYKIGVMYGNPETMPGGQSFKFASSLTVRIYGKDEFDKKLSGNLPAWKAVSGQINKWKVPIVNRAFEFKMAAIDLPQKKLGQGEVDDWNLVKGYLQDYEALTKNGNKGWTMFGENYATLDECRERLVSDPAFGQEVRESLIEHLSAEVTGEDEGPVNE